MLAKALPPSHGVQGDFLIWALQSWAKRQVGLGAGVTGYHCTHSFVWPGAVSFVSGPEDRSLGKGKATRHLWDKS